MKSEGVEGGLTRDKETGKTYREYTYNKDFPKEMAVVWLSTETSLPRMWYSAVRTSEKTAVLSKIIYRNLEANVPIPDAHFQPPEGIEWQP